MFNYPVLLSSPSSRRFFAYVFVVSPLLYAFQMSLCNANIFLCADDFFAETIKYNRSTEIRHHTYILLFHTKLQKVVYSSQTALDTFTTPSKTCVRPELPFK